MFLRGNCRHFFSIPNFLAICSLLVYSRVRMVSSQDDDGKVNTDWNTGEKVNKTKAEALQLFTDANGKLHINGWVPGTSAAFKLYFNKREKQQHQSAGSTGQCSATTKGDGTDTEVNFTIKACLKGVSCMDGLLLCFVGQLDPNNRDDLMRQFRLENVKNSLTEKCITEAKNNKWPEWKGKEVHGLHITTDEHSGTANISASYSNSIFTMELSGDGCISVQLGDDLRACRWSNDLAWRSLANGASLASQRTLCTLPLDMLAGNPDLKRDPLFAAIGQSDQCKMQLAFEGEGLKPCMDKDCNNTAHKEVCDANWRSVKPARLLDMLKVVKQNGQKREYIVEGEFVVRAGFLEKPAEINDGAPFSFTALKNSVNEAKKVWSSQSVLVKDYIEKMLFEDMRDLNETMDYDYVSIPDEWRQRGVEVLVHTCDGAVFVSMARSKGNKPAAESIEQIFTESAVDFDWSKDFVRLERCCMGPTKDREVKTYGIGEMLDTDNWPVKYRFFDKVLVGHTPSPYVNREIGLAAKYKYSMSGAWRPFYLNKDYANSNETNPYMDATFFMPPNYGVGPLGTHHVTALYKIPDKEVMQQWTTGSVHVQMRQYVVNCTHCSAEGAGHYTNLRDVVFYLPRLVAVEIKGDKYNPDSKERVGHYDLINMFKVDTFDEYKVRKNSWISYDEKEWAAMENQKNGR